MANGWHNRTVHHRARQGKIMTGLLEVVFRTVEECRLPACWTKNLFYHRYATVQATRVTAARVESRAPYNSI